MKKINIFLICLFVVMLVIIPENVSAQSNEYLNKYFDKAVEELEYRNKEEFKDRFNKGEYVKYLPYMTLNDNGDGRISMGGELNSLLMSNDKKEQVSWKQNLFSNYEERIKEIRMISHLYNRLIYNYRQKELYDYYLSQANVIYDNLDKEKVDKGVLMDLKATLERIEYSNSQIGVKGITRQIESVLGDINLEKKGFEKYPESITNKAVYNVNEIIDVEMHKYNSQIKQMENYLREIKRSRWPQLSLNYNYSFKDVFDEGFDNTRHELRLSLKGNFSITDHDSIQYETKNSLERESNEYDEDDDDNDNDEETDASASLSLFSFPRYKESRVSNQISDVERNIERAKGFKETKRTQQQHELREDINKINHFNTLYQIEKKRQAKFEKDDFDNQIEEIELLIDKLNYYLELEEYKFNYSYLYSRLKRRNEESKILLDILER